MASYSINLSDGSILATLHPLEVNGPSNRSTPRQVHDIRDVGNEVEVSGNGTYRFVSGFTFDIAESGVLANNTTYTVASDSFLRFTFRAPHNSTGQLAGNAQTGGLFFLVSSSVTDYYVWFNSDGANNDPASSPIFAAELSGLTGIEIAVATGDSHVVVANAIRDELDTWSNFTATTPGAPDVVHVDVAPGVIPAGKEPRQGSVGIPVGDVRTVIPVASVPAPPALPYGEIAYTNTDSRTTLTLPGRGTINYGEAIIDNFVHLLENFAAEDSPDTNANLGDSPFGQPLRGQWWYNITANEEGFLFYDGSDWTRNLDIDEGALIFRDLEDSNKDIYLTGSETNLPSPWPGAPNNEPGFVIWPATDPLSGAALFRVLSNQGAEQLRVEHDGRIETDGALYVKNVTSYGDDNIFDGNLGIGGGTFDGAVTRTLTVEGNGIAVNADTGQNAGLELNSLAGQTSYIDFTNGGTLNGNIATNDLTTDQPLEINSAVTNDVSMVTGGGNVGINTIDPSRRLDVVGESEFNGDVYIIDSDQIFNDSYGIESVSGAIMKTGVGGKTWQFTPGDNTAAGIIVNDSLGAATFIVDENVGTHIDQYDFFVDSDTIYVDAANDRVGINKVPVESFDATGVNMVAQFTGDITMTATGGVVDINTGAGDIDVNSAANLNLTAATLVNVTGDARFNNRVGVNTAPPVTNAPIGTDVWLAVGGDIRATDDILTDDQFLGSANGEATPAYSFLGDEDTGMFQAAADTLAFATGGAESLRIQPTGMLNVGAITDYETLLSDDDDIPNLKYVDDRIDNISWREPIVARSQILYADQSTFPVTGIVDDVTLSVGDRVLFSDVTTVADRDVWIWTGATWTRDDDPNDRTIGDAVYIQQGSDAGKVFAFDNENEWSLISGSGGATFFAPQPVQTAVAAQTLFTLPNPYKMMPDGSRLLVYVDGVKYIKGVGYTEDTPTTVTLAPPVPFVGGEQVEFYIIAESTPNANWKREVITGQSGLGSVPFALVTYVYGSESTLVYLNGQKAIVNDDYDEAPSGTEIVWTGTPLVPGDVIEVYASVPITAGTKLGDVDDIDNAALTPSDNDILAWDVSVGRWTLRPGPPGIENGVLFDELVADGTGTQIVFNTTYASTTAKGGGKAHQQVFVNGILQKEGGAFAYTVTGANQITFNLGSEPPANADVTIYEL